MSLGGAYNLSINAGGVSHNASSLLALSAGQSRCSIGGSGSGLRDTPGGANNMQSGASMTGPGATDGFSLKMSSAGLDCSVVHSQSCAKMCNNSEDFDANKSGNTSTNTNQYSSDFQGRQVNNTLTSNGEVQNGNTMQKSRIDMSGIPDDSKLLANPKGIIKSYLPQAAAFDSQKFDAYRELCMAHADEYYKSQKGGGVWAECHVCSTTHPHWNTLQRHLQTHIDFRPFSCDKCERTFYSQSKLKRHQIIHSDVKPYKCPVCDRRLGRTEHLKRHLLVHTDDKPYACSSCTHTTKRLDGIRRHIKRKHGIAGAEIVVMASGVEGREEGVGDLRQVMSVIEENEQQRKQGSRAGVNSGEVGGKKKTKKKKKKAGGDENNEGTVANPSGNDMVEAMSKELGGNLLEVAARFGLGDLRLPASTPTTTQSQPSRSTASVVSSAGIYEPSVPASAGFVNTNAAHQQSGQSKESTKSYQHAVGVDSNSAAHRGPPVQVEELKQPSWDGGLLLGGLQPQQMHLLYHSLARSHPQGLHDGGMGGATCNLGANDIRQAGFCGGGASMNHMGSEFIMNSAGVPMRYLSGMDGAMGNPAARHVNPMLFSPRNTARNLGHFGGADMNMAGGAEAMISQYIQSQQRFAPPVWGFTNPNYHNY